MIVSPLNTPNLDNHLRNTLSAQCLTTNKPLALQACDCVAYRGKQKEYGCCDQTCPLHDNAEPLYQAHYSVYRSPHVVRCEPPYKVIEGTGGRADAEKERYLNEYDDQPRRARSILASTYAY